MSKESNIYIKKAKRKRLIKRTIIFLIFLVIAGIVFVTQTNFFNIKNVDLTGEYVITGDGIREKTSSLIGENIFFIDETEIKKNIKTDPYVDTIKISKKYPNILKIDVKEKKGFYYILENGVYNILNDELVLLEKVDNIEDKELVEVKGIELGNTSIGEQIENNSRINKVLYYFYRMACELEKQGETVKVTAIDLGELSNVKAYIGNIEIRLGADEDLIKKMNKAINIYKSGLVKSYIDVSFEGSPVFDYIEK